MFRKAFTLMEVNLAILVMAGGILSIVSLYSLGFRENSQSSEDVAAAAFADQILGRITTALSATNVVWRDFNRIDTIPNNGWADYFNSSNGSINRDNGQSELDAIASALPGDLRSMVTSGYEKPNEINAWGLVVHHDDGSPVVRIAFRASKRKSMLLSAPLFFTSVVFQGQQENR